MVLQDTLRLVVPGLAIGVPLTFAATRVVSSRVFGVDPADPAVLAAAMAVILTVAIAASLPPERRASRVDRIIALRCE